MANSYPLLSHGRTISFWADKTAPDVEGNILTSYQYFNNSQTPIADVTLKFTLGHGLRLSGYYEGGVGGTNVFWGGEWSNVTPDDRLFHHYLIWISRTGDGFGDTISAQLFVDGVYRGSQLLDQHHPQNQAWFFTPFGIGSRLTGLGTPDAEGYQYGQYRESDGALGGFGQLWLGFFTTPQLAIGNLYNQGYVYLGDTGTHGAKGTIAPGLYNNFDYPYSQTYGYSNGFQVPLTSDYVAYSHPPGLFASNTQATAPGTIKQFESRSPLGLKSYSSSFYGSPQYATTTGTSGFFTSNSVLSLAFKRDPILSPSGILFRNKFENSSQNFTLGYTSTTIQLNLGVINGLTTIVSWSNSMPQDTNWHTLKIETSYNITTGFTYFKLTIDGQDLANLPVPPNAQYQQTFTSFNHTYATTEIAPDFNGALANLTVNTYSTTLDKPFTSEITSHDQTNSYIGSLAPYYIYGPGLELKPWTAKFTLTTHNYQIAQAALSSQFSLTAREQASLVDQALLTSQASIHAQYLRLRRGTGQLTSRAELRAKPFHLIILESQFSLRANSIHVLNGRADLTVRASQTSTLDRYRLISSQMALIASMLSANSRIRSTISRPKTTATESTTANRIRNVNINLISQASSQAQARATYRPPISLQAQAQIMAKPRHDYTGHADLTASASISTRPYNFKQFSTSLRATADIYAPFARVIYYDAHLQVQAFELSFGRFRKLDPYYQLWIKPESRLLTISPESRLLTISPENKNLMISSENRIITIIPENRVNIIEGSTK